MKITVEVTGDNEGTASPWWAVVDPHQNMRADLAAAAGQITGPFFSRAEAEGYLKRRRHAYSKRARVWCFSGYYSDQWHEGSRKAEAEEKAYKKTLRFVYLPVDVHGDGPWAHRVARAGVYERHENSQGAVSVRIEDGGLLGVKASEFVDAGGVLG